VKFVDDICKLFRKIDSKTTRARVPQPSLKDYLVRPEWKVKTPLEHAKQQKDDNDEDIAKEKSKKFEKYIKSLKQPTKFKAKNLSLGGGKMN